MPLNSYLYYTLTLDWIHRKLLYLASYLMLNWIHENSRKRISYVTLDHMLHSNKYGNIIKFMLRVMYHGYRCISTSPWESQCRLQRAHNLHTKPNQYHHLRFVFYCIVCACAIVTNWTLNLFCTGHTPKIKCTLVARARYVCAVTTGLSIRYDNGQSTLSLKSFKAGCLLSTCASW